MWTFIGGIVSVCVGILFIILWWPDFIKVLAGGLPITVALCGALAIYIGIDELKEKLRSRKEEAQEPSAPEAGPEAKTEEKPVAEVTEEAPERGYWIVGYGDKNLETLKEKSLIGFPEDKESLVKERMKVGDHVVFYALSPQSKFVGFAEIVGEYEYGEDEIWTPIKKGEKWPHRRRVEIKRWLAKEKWVDGKEVFERLELLSEAREKGTDVGKSFASKLRAVPNISHKDYQTIIEALPE